MPCEPGKHAMCLPGSQGILLHIHGRLEDLFSIPRAVRCLLPEGSERKGKSDWCKRGFYERMSQVAGTSHYISFASVVRYSKSARSSPCSNVPLRLFRGLNRENCTTCEGYLLFSDFGETIDTRINELVKLVIAWTQKSRTNGPFSSRLDQFPGVRGVRYLSPVMRS